MPPSCQLGGGRVLELIRGEMNKCEGRMAHASATACINLGTLPSPQSVRDYRSREGLLERCAHHVAALGTAVAVLGV
jgi:hypothetical protein